MTVPRCFYDVTDFEDVVAYLRNPATDLVMGTYMYARCLREAGPAGPPGSTFYWAVINQAIMARWSVTTLKQIKRDAWAAMEEPSNA